MKNANIPVYIIPQDAPQINQYKGLFEYLLLPENHTLTLTVQQDMVFEGEVMMLQDIISTMQHYPQLIEKMLLGIELKFTEIEDSEIYFPDLYWKRQVEYYRWFNKMFDMPLVLFYLHDEDARFYCLAGDMLAEQSVTTTGAQDSGGRSEINFTRDQALILVQRLHNACWLMMVYCHASGFNPKSYIEAMIATFSFDFNITYESVYEAYKKDIEEGLQLRLQPNKRKGE